MSGADNEKTKEIVERLRLGGPNASEISDEAADLITRLVAQFEEAQADNKRLRNGIEIMANREHWGAAIDVSTSVGVRAWDFARALLSKQEERG